MFSSFHCDALLLHTTVEVSEKSLFGLGLGYPQCLPRVDLVTDTFSAITHLTAISWPTGAASAGASFPWKCLIHGHDVECHRGRVQHYCVSTASGLRSRDRRAKTKPEPSAAAPPRPNTNAGTSFHLSVNWSLLTSWNFHQAFCLHIYCWMLGRALRLQVQDRPLSETI